MKGHWDHRMDARLLRGLQNRSDPNNDPSPANGTVAILIVLLALFCFLWYDSCCLRRLYSFRLSIFSMMILTNVTLLLLTRAPRNLRRCSGRSRSGNNVTADGHLNSQARGPLSPQEAEIALVESSLRNMMASMSTMMEARAWGNSLGMNNMNMNAGDRREYIANVLMTKVRIHVLVRYWRIQSIVGFDSFQLLFSFYRKWSSCNPVNRLWNRPPIVPRVT
jgi:hypothetical protein